MHGNANGYFCEPIKDRYVQALHLETTGTGEKKGKE